MVPYFLKTTVRVSVSSVPIPIWLGCRRIDILKLTGLFVAFVFHHSCHCVVPVERVQDGLEETPEPNSRRTSRMKSCPISSSSDSSIGFRSNGTDVAVLVVATSCSSVCYSSLVTLRAEVLNPSATETEGGRSKPECPSNILMPIPTPLSLPSVLNKYLIVFTIIGRTWSCWN